MLGLRMKTPAAKRRRKTRVVPDKKEPLAPTTAGNGAVGGAGAGRANRAGDAAAESTYFTGEMDPQYRAILPRPLGGHPYHRICDVERAYCHIDDFYSRWPMKRVIEGAQKLLATDPSEVLRALERQLWNMTEIIDRVKRCHRDDAPLAARPNDWVRPVIMKPDAQGRLRHSWEILGEKGEEAGGIYLQHDISSFVWQCYETMQRNAEVVTSICAIQLPKVEGIDYAELKRACNDVLGDLRDAKAGQRIHSSLTLLRAARTTQSIGKQHKPEEAKAPPPTEVANVGPKAKTSGENAIALPPPPQGTLRSFIKSKGITGGELLKVTISRFDAYLRRHLIMPKALNQDEVDRRRKINPQSRIAREMRFDALEPGWIKYKNGVGL